MSDKVFVGLNADSVQKATDISNITKVVLWYDDEAGFAAGTDDGYVFETFCPWATQAMANALLANFNGYKYTSVYAESAILDPAAELGDGVVVASYYTPLVQKETTYDSICASDFSSPEDEQVNHEYSYVEESKRDQNGVVKLNKSYYGTKITRKEGLTIEKITGDSVEAKVVMNADELSFYAGSSKVLYFDPVANVYRFEGELNVADNFIVDKSGNVIMNGDVEINGSLYIPNGSISFSKLDSNSQNKINSAVNIANDAANEAADANDAVKAWTYRGTTYIDGTQIQTGTVSASVLQGGQVTLKDYLGTKIGHIALTNTTTGIGMWIISQKGGFKIMSEGNFWVDTQGVENSYSFGVVSTRFQSSLPVTPVGDDGATLGMPSARWSDVYAVNSQIQTSDRNEKKNIQYDLSKFSGLFDRLKPSTFQFLNGSSGRTHFGIIAQDFDEAIMAEGYTSQDVAALIKSDNGKGGTIYGIRYAELIPLLISEVQNLKKALLTKGVLD